MHPGPRETCVEIQIWKIYSKIVLVTPPEFLCEAIVVLRVFFFFLSKLNSKVLTIDHKNFKGSMQRNSFSLLLLPQLKEHGLCFVFDKPMN